MNLTPEGWEANVEKLVRQCADKVILELEEIIMARLRETGEAVFQSFFLSQPSTVIGVAQTKIPMELETDAKYVLYAFGIIKADKHPESSLHGMEDRPCRLVQFRDLGMLVCPVPVKDYDEDALHSHMEDIAWVESHARRHEETLLKVMEKQSVIPLPFCTIFSEDESIKRQLAQNSEKILADLARLEDHYEMQVKLLANRKRLLEKLQEDLPYTGSQNGGGYFQKRQWEKKIEEEMERVMDDYGESLYQDLSGLSAEGILLDRSGIPVAEGQHVVFAAQYLMDQENSEAWNKKLQEFDELADPLGFLLEVSGPWPPYHFSRLIKEEENEGG